MTRGVWGIALVGLLMAGCADGGADGSTSATGTGSSGSGGSGQGGGGGAAATTTGVGGGTSDPCADVECPDGETCNNGTCFPGCQAAQDCEAGSSCCSGACIDVATSLDHCGACDDPCPLPQNTIQSCEAGACQGGGCLEGFSECNGDPDDGCETEGTCNCTPGEEQPCYEGPAGTAGVGICQAGTRKCNAAGNAFSLCFGWVGPGVDACGNGLDEDCDGAPDNPSDLDGDGWTVCQGDCCETTVDCSEPALVNPGAFEFVGNGIDDDCDAGSSDTVAPAACSTAETFTVSPGALAQAMDICQTTTANAPLATRKWGLVSASLRNADGSAVSGARLTQLQTLQAAVLADYGTGGIVPRQGTTMAGISTGRMRDKSAGDFVEPNGGTSFGVDGSPPAAYLAANGGNLPTSMGCGGNNCPAGTGANDSVALRLEIRVPTNARSLAYDFRFFSSEYWAFSCNLFNDFYLALLTSNAMGIPADKNISFDSLGNPVSVNNGFFEHCQARSCYTCPLGTGALAGTGMDTLFNPQGPQPEGVTGGGTAWLTTTAPVVPGETITLDLMVFDVQDNILDSVSLLDAFRWSVQASGVGTGPAG